MRLTTDELAAYDQNGFLVRESAFSDADVAEMKQASEEVCDMLVARADEHAKARVSQYYIFERDEADNTLIKWEPGDDQVIQGVEPVAHLHPIFQKLAEHSAFTDPCRSILGVEDVGLFTEKLNVKRARVGGQYALHKDFPYWSHAEDPENLVTVWVALDDATAENGALEVLPGSHKLANPPMKESELAFERNEIDPDRLDTSRMVSVEVPAGGAVFFGPHLIHRSGPNNSTRDRRALLYTYQRSDLRDTQGKLRRLDDARAER